MNVLYTITGYPPAIGGAQAYAHQLAAGLIRRGHRAVAAAYWDRSRTDWLWGTTLRAASESGVYTLDGVDVHSLAWSRGEKLRLVPWVLGYYAWQGLAIRAISRRMLGRLHALGDDWQVIHNVRQGREALSYASLALARSLGVPFVLTPVHHPRWGGWLHRHFQALYRQADALIALTQVEKETLVGFGVPSERIHVTGTGPVLAPTAAPGRFRDRHGLDGDPIVLFLGTHFRYKGLEALLAAARLVWKRCPSARFVFVGPETRYSWHLFNRQHDTRHLRLGAVDLQTKTDALAACSLLCVPSAQESFGAVYTEAWVMGKPVIAGDIPAVREVVSDGVDGFLVRQDPDEIAARILVLLDDDGLAQRMGEVGQTKVLERYTWDRLVESTTQVYAWIMAAPTRGIEPFHDT